MSDFDGTESASAPEGVEQSTGPAGDQQQAVTGDQSTENPHWKAVKDSLDPISYHKIEAHLKEADKNAETRISSVNSQLAAYKEFGTPEQIRNYAMIAQRIDANPEVIYTALGEFLKANGRMPETQQEVQASVDAVEEGADAPVTDPRLDDLVKGQEQMREFLANQQQERLVQQAETALDQEVEQLRAAHPDFDDADIREVIDRAASYAQRTGKVPALEDAAQNYLTNVVNRIRAVPRPADSAPRLTPTGGGIPTGGPQKTLGKLSRGETQDLMATLIASANRPAGG